MERQAYPSDLTDAQWRLIAPLIPEAKPGGRPRKYETREVINGLLYLSREGCSWRALPAALRVGVRPELARDPNPSGACFDSQSAKTASGGAEVGVDGGKKVRG